ncbi:unnamed protein product [Phytophthora fragariaefolia]|uniref:Unnamed protein product n=1 Tax=Phytophthora fragariaefolia TaxID=1490495 RepID=A0A9W6TJ00_9STRA|nr:unnamed protein product [Phytophthora fragariaefolia]
METRGPLEEAEPKTVGVVGVYEEEAKESAASVEDEAEEKVSDVVADSPKLTMRRRRSRTLRRAIFENVCGSDEKDSDENLAVPDLARLSPKCVIDGDANLMDSAADAYTCLNSDEDMSVEEDQESCGDDVDDWYIGELTDEDSEDDGGEDLPESAHPEKFGLDPTYEYLYDGPYGPSDSVMAVGDDPLALLYYFTPPKLWTQISFESNRYHTQSIPQRARTIRSQQRRAGQKVEELGDIRSRLAGVPDIEPWEVLRVMGLLIARMLMPMGKCIAAHWSTNKSPSASIDRAWTIRPVVDVLQRTFARGYRAPPVISSDEPTLPSRSRYNPTRPTPQVWDESVRRLLRRDGVLFEVCDAVVGFGLATAFVFAKVLMLARLQHKSHGAKSNLRTPVPTDNNTGEAAVLRNINALCPPSTTSPWRLVITDRFYTSIKLALELLHRRMYLIGTIQTDRAGYVKDVILKKEIKQVNKQKIVTPPQGTIKLAANERFPQLTATMWMDPTPVYLLLSGGSRKTATVTSTGDGVGPGLSPLDGRCRHPRPTPDAVQLSYETRKYYKTLFLGLFDMALVNAFIVFRHHKALNDNRPPRKTRPPKHYAFFETLLEQLLAVDSAETYQTIEVRYQNYIIVQESNVVSAISTCHFNQRATTARERTVASPSCDTVSYAPAFEGTVDMGGHRLEENPDTVDNEQGLKKHQRSCKWCVLFKTKPRKYTKYFWYECSTGNRRFVNVSQIAKQVLPQFRAALQKYFLQA